MRISESLSILMLSFLLVLGYLVLDKSILSALVQWKTVSTENSPHNWEVYSGIYRYAANNIFDQGYAREVGPEVHQRLSVYPENTVLENGRFVVPGNSSEGVVKLVLPEGFKDGILSLKITAKLKFSIRVSNDLQNWDLYDYPGFGAQAVYSLSLGKENSAKKYVYLNFLPSRNESLDIYFDIFQYISDFPLDNSEHYGVLFYPEVDIDYEGKQIIRPAIYAKKTPKTIN